MTQPNLLELAKQGDPAAIATMMNQQLQPRGITATTELLPGRCLQVVFAGVTLESSQVLNRQALTTFVKKGLQNLGVQTLDSVKLIGRQAGSSEPAWIEDVVMTASPISDSFEAMTDPANQEDEVEASTSASRPDLPPPPPNRGVASPSAAQTTNPSDYDSNTGVTHADGMHDFYDSQLSDSSPDTSDLPSYSPIPGAYRPLESDNALLLNDADFALRGTHALDYPDQPLEESEVDDDYGDDYDVMPGGSHALHYPDDPLDDPDDYGDDYDVMPGGSHALHYPDDPLDDPDDYGDDYDQGFTVTPSAHVAALGDSLTLDEYDDEQGFVAGENANTAGFQDFSEGAAPDTDENLSVASDGRESIPPGEEYTPIPWTALIVSLVATWIFGLVGYSIWSANASRTAQQPASGVSPAGNPATSPTIATNIPSVSPASPASPTGASPATPTDPALQISPAPVASPTPVAASPTAPSPTTASNTSPVASPTAPASLPAQPTPRVNPSPQSNLAQANLTAPPAPPAIACRPVPFGANSAPIELSNLGFDTSIADADGHYVVGCITNHSDQAIAKLTISFQGRSTQNQGVSQTGSTDLTFSNLRPRQAVPFRSLYTVNPEVNTLTINSISWVTAGSAQPRQVQVNFPLRR